MAQALVAFTWRDTAGSMLVPLKDGERPLVTVVLATKGIRSVLASTGRLAETTWTVTEVGDEVSRPVMQDEAPA